MAVKAGFVWYELMTSGDVHAAAKFYGDVVGWEVKDSGMPMTYLIFGKDGKDVGGMMSWQSMGMTDKPTSWKAHIYTPDVDAEVEAVKRDGGMVFRPPMDIPNIGRFAVVGDPQGVEYMLFQPNTQYAPPRLKQDEVGNVGWHELMTTDWEKAWEFYSSHYGWEKDYAHDMGPMGVYQTFRIDTDKYTGAMMTAAKDGSMGSPTWTYYFQVVDVDAAV
ncbi:MAG: VOC family protein, partial [Terriglobus sp.]